MNNKRYLQALEKEIRSALEIASNEIMLATYGIIRNLDGTIYDDINNITYSSREQWIAVYLDDSRQDVEHISSRKGWFDD